MHLGDCGPMARLSRGPASERFISQLPELPFSKWHMHYITLINHRARTK